jgi:hypothetical protein
MNCIAECMAKDATADFATEVSQLHLMFVRATNRS